MNFNEYQELAQRTKNNKLDQKTRLAVAALGLVGEAAEVSELVKKHLGHGHELDVDKIVKELGDTMWYIAELCSIINISMDFTAKANVDKLMKRYPNGFSEEKSIYRFDE